MCEHIFNLFFLLDLSFLYFLLRDAFLFLLNESLSNFFFYIISQDNIILKEEGKKIHLEKERNN